MVRGGSGPADRKRNCRGPFFARSRKDPVRSDLRRGEEEQEGSDPVCCEVRRSRRRDPIRSDLRRACWSSCPPSL
ncbi:hypothetical protein CesoFtcFv8_024057 [Champsocephalus esox]|uniref:Uncharacterized protein n=1 Tax=Champsocephalus esox TaxID=159716 RepID=A0AAN8B502_9TELE|nr:hypothetical protein CesoFtcFv8_024057 [Champsocephalus esox]